MMKRCKKNAISPNFLVIALLPTIILTCKLSDLKEYTGVFDTLVEMQRIREENPEPIFGEVQDEPAPVSASTPDQAISEGAYDLPLKPVGFINYGEFDAVVTPYTFIPLGSIENAPPPKASTISSANDGVGDWPNASRYITVPVGAYSWCIEWEEGDLDEDGQINYFHYIQNDPTILDENDSDELEFAEEVAIMAPPSAAPIYGGKCEEDLSPKYLWVEVGAGDYVGMDVDSSEGPFPDDSKASPGITAICWDNVEYIHFSGKAFCTYKSVNWDQCLDGPYKGRMYTASEIR